MAAPHPCAAHAASEREENTIMTHRLTLGQRLFLLVSLPLLGMVGYAALTAWAHWQEAVNMRRAAARGFINATDCADSGLSEIWSCRLTERNT